jgi:hypothetical protein
MRVRRLIGYVPQQPLTGYGNAWLFARLYDVPRRERRGRVEEALAQVGLEKVAGRLASTYSGGMVRGRAAGPARQPGRGLRRLQGATVVGSRPPPGCSAGWPADRAGQGIPASGYRRLPVGRDRETPAGHDAGGRQRRDPPSGIVARKKGR